MMDDYLAILIADHCHKMKVGVETGDSFLMLSSWPLKNGAVITRSTGCLLTSGTPNKSESEILTQFYKIVYCWDFWITVSDSIKGCWKLWGSR